MKDTVRTAKQQKPNAYAKMKIKINQESGEEAIKRRKEERLTIKDAPIWKSHHHTPHPKNNNSNRKRFSVVPLSKAIT